MPRRPSWTPGRRRRARRPAAPDRAVSVLLALAAIVTAVVGARAALLGDESSDTLQRVIREDVEQGAAVVENVRFLYLQEALAALDVAELQIRAEELAREARDLPPPGREVLVAEARVRGAYARELRAISPLLQEPRYLEGADGFDLGARLADLEAQDPQSFALDPDAMEAHGADLNRESSLLAATAILAAVGFFLGALAPGFPSRKPLVAMGYGAVGVAVVAALVVEVSL